MAHSPDTSHATAEASALRASVLRWPGPIFDPIDMDHIFQLDKTLFKQLSAQRLQTQAEVHRVASEGLTRAAELLK
ncbi:MAG TPA: hypothetical protein VE650_09335 [Acetobacteraceae bacterium]|nr:hypothetical protein [Acetobacteraceae bacterium]